MTSTSITKHLTPLPKLMTFKAQWSGETVEQDFDSVMLRCDKGKIYIYQYEYDDDPESEPLRFYSAPEFTCTKEKVNKVNHYFQTNDYPLEISYYRTSPELVFINGFGNLFGSDKVIPLETIIDDVLAILLSEDKSENK